MTAAEAGVIEVLDEVPRRALAFAVIEPLSIILLGSQRDLGWRAQ